MCGRAYSTYTEQELAIRYLNRKAPKIPAFKPNYNLAPTQKAPIVRVDESGNRQIELYNWGLIPSWSPEFKTKFSTINAKSETVFESRMYKGPVLMQRCIVPLSGFIEWKAAGEGEKAPKRPFKIWLKNEPILSMAGIWETWRAGTPEERHSFSILTTEANSFMKKLHHRMPVILALKDEEAWLDPEMQDEVDIAKLLKPYDSKKMDAAEISTAVNSPRNNMPEVLVPVNLRAEVSGTRA
jgi:putative SOS response-associated peptidase YedK